MKRKSKPEKDRLQLLLEELSWYDPDDWRLTDEEQVLLGKFYASLNRLMQMRGRAGKADITVGAVTFKEKPKGVRLR